MKKKSCYIMTGILLAMALTSACADGRAGKAEEAENVMESSEGMASETAAQDLSDGGAQDQETEGFSKNVIKRKK